MRITEQRLKQRRGQHRMTKIVKNYHIVIICTMITIKEDIDSITSILSRTFQIVAFRRDYNIAFGQIASILYRYGLNENHTNLRIRFILCMQEFFESIPEDKWKLKDPQFIKQSEEFAIAKFREWILEQIT